MSKLNYVQGCGNYLQNKEVNKMTAWLPFLKEMFLIQVKCCLCSTQALTILLVETSLLISVVVI